jgi:hypothetical protein
MNRLLASINLRLRALEAVKVTLESTVEALRLVGLQRIDAAIAPLIVETQQQIDDLGEQLGDVEASIAELLSGGVPADNVTETATRAFVTPAQKTEIGQLRTDLTAVDDAKLPKSGGTLTGIRQQMSCSTSSLSISRYGPSISGRSGSIWSWSENACRGSAANSCTNVRSIFSSMLRKQAACATDRPFPST